jgi:hypothetical protein
MPDVIGKMRLGRHVLWRIAYDLVLKQKYRKIFERERG